MIMAEAGSCSSGSGSGSVTCHWRMYQAWSGCQSGRRGGGGVCAGVAEGGSAPAAARPSIATNIQRPRIRLSR